MYIKQTIILVICIAFGVFLLSRTTGVDYRYDNEPAVCNQDAKLCPDGSSLSRQGPRCEFDNCPAVVAPEDPKTPDPIMCTMDAKMCPDGSYVGRGGPKCEFTACPAGHTLNMAKEYNGVSIEPLRVIEDSRCPEGAMCIWAGRLVVLVQLSSGTKTEEVSLTQGESYRFLNKTVTLIDALPHPSIAEEGMRSQSFVFEVK